MDEQTLTLRDFQGSRGVPVDAQILLLDNPRFPGRAHCALLPYLKRGRRAVTLGASYLGLVPWWGQRGKQLSVPKRSAVLFLGFKDTSIDRLVRLEQLFERLRDLPQQTFSIIVGKGDYELGDETASQIPDNVARVIANNTNTDHPRVSYLPMGRDFRSRQLFDRVGPTAQKRCLVYCNYSVNTHPRREEVYERVKEFPFVDFEHMGNFLDYSISRLDFMRRVAGSHFCICPRGNAFDTFRMWDCLYLGTIPIVVREADYHEQLNDLPILFLDRYEDFSDLSEDFLRTKYQQMQTTRYNYSKLQLRYWVQPAFDAIDSSVPV